MQNPLAAAAAAGHIFMYAHCVTRFGTMRSKRTERGRLALEMPMFIATWACLGWQKKYVQVIQVHGFSVELAMAGGYKSCLRYLWVILSMFSQKFKIKGLFEGVWQPPCMLANVK
jgi:hypothetical protein